MCLKIISIEELLIFEASISVYVFDKNVSLFHIDFFSPTAHCSVQLNFVSVCSDLQQATARRLRAAQFVTKRQLKEQTDFPGGVLGIVMADS